MNVPLQLVMGIAPAHRNQYLFSDHYLDHLLPQDPRWGAAQAEAGEFLAWLQGLYAREQKQLARYTENQLEEHWFKPILAQLGHVFEGQAGIPGLDVGVKWPDYVFFPDEPTRQAAVGAQNTEEYAADALAVGEVKHWDVPLSKKQKGGGASFEAQNPSWQIDYYLRATGLDWGILSNGWRWRLVHRDSSQRLSIYYEVDLVDLLKRGDAGAMRYFTLFFHQAAFRPDAQGRVFLADALAESRAYAVALEEDVETNVYRALERLMQGFLDLPANDLGTDDVRQIYENSLYLLYRLLFILYGESRGLLPLHLTSYRDNYSLDHVKREIAELQTPPAPMTTLYWGRAKQLFQIINGDNLALNRHLGVPRYNGGLFDPKVHPFLETCAVGDRALVEAIDLLSRRTSETGREFVDYRTLGVRHLGSIYEGLLEYQPRYATEPTVAVRGNKGEHWVKAAEAPDGARVVDRREAGQTYLETDRGERKATGSYYTPQYIVEYIVDNTLGPLVAEAVERVKERTKETRGKAARAEAEQSLRQSSGQALVGEILDLKCLDPSMGSGHFLVEATEYLARALATDPYVETEAPVEEDLTYWKRRVVERCIYGVDKNPLAVELAKLSLWLATVAEDRPLSFLDHHLKCGDSLIGARVDDLGAVPPVMLSKKALREREAQYAAGVRQANLFETRLIEKLPIVMGRILEITEVESDSYETIQAKEATDRAVRQLKAPFRAVANLWASAHFGNEFTQGEYDEALGLIGRREELLALPSVQRAQGMADERRFFHWELAFPEVFYDEHGQRLGERAGFDAVVGNPPYGDILTRAEKTYLENVGFQAGGSGNNDVFRFFTERGIVLLSRQRGLGFIVPNSCLGGAKYRNFRIRISEISALREILDFKTFRHFDADVFTCVLLLQAGVPSEVYSCAYLAAPQGRIIDQESHELQIGAAAPNTWLPKGSIYQRIQESGRFIRFDEVCESKDAGINYQRVDVGWQRRAKSKIAERILYEGRQQDRRDPRYLKGEDIDRFLIDPQAQRWLHHNYAALVYEGETVSVNHEWAKKPLKILTRQTGDRIIAALDSAQRYTGRSLHSHVLMQERYSLYYILAVLNSRFISYYYNVLAREKGRALAQVKLKNIRQLPIRRIEFTTPVDERQRLVEEASARAEKAVTKVIASGSIGSDSPLDRKMLSKAASPQLDFVGERLTAQPEQSDVVHDLLAHLAERMIEMHKEKQERVEGFWLDLEGVTDAETFDVLRNKGKWESSLWKAKACRPFVDEDSRSTRHLNESLGWNEDAFKAFVKMLVGKVQGLSDLVAVYRAHSSTYRDLVARIEATDWLIDQIVYKLYGLTKEEIAIVEGREQ